MDKFDSDKIKYVTNTKVELNQTVRSLLSYKDKAIIKSCKKFHGVAKS